jgi:hypothetical protein
MNDFQIGDKIKDVEDGDCYYLGIWQGDDKYLLTGIVWCGKKIESEIIGTIIDTQWWYLELDK